MQAARCEIRSRIYASVALRGRHGWVSAQWIKPYLLPNGQHTRYALIQTKMAT